MSNEQNSIDFYDSHAENYDLSRWNTVAGEYNNQTQKKIVLEFADIKGGERTLDIATGTGRFALELAKCGCEVAVTDSSRKMLEITKGKFKTAEHIDKLTIAQGVATKLPFEDETFDICICINALNHIDGYSIVLAEINRVLKLGGVSITSYTNWFSLYFPIGLWVNLRAKALTRDVYTKWFSPMEIRKLHNDNNLEIVGVQGSLHIPTKIKFKLLFNVLKKIDQLLRRRPCRCLAPQLFYKAIRR